MKLVTAMVEVPAAPMTTLVKLLMEPVAAEEKVIAELVTVAVEITADR